jgi:homocysteine S-methyltransferase
MGDAILVLDGGTGHLLKEALRDGADGAPSLGFAAAATANETASAAVARLHAEYVDAGASVITANSFGCTRFSLARAGRAADAPRLAEEAGRLCRDAAAAARPRAVLAAGSLPPLCESYARPALGPEFAQAEYAELAAALAPHSDVLLCETMSTTAEALAAATAAAATGRPVWVAFTIVDALTPAPALRGGEALANAAAAVAAVPGVEALLVNCCAPQAVTAALPVLRAAAPAGMRVGGFANGFRQTTSAWLVETTGEGCAEGLVEPPAEEYDAAGVLLPEALARHAAAWIDAGATIVGGCCGTGPAHIRALAELRERLARAEAG